MGSPKKPLPLRRYTNLAQALYILNQRKIILMNPANWDDRNDSYYLEQYRIKVGAKSVAALCFARGEETYHHWSVFSGGTDGICINFDQLKLVKELENDPAVRCGAVKYKNFDEMAKENLSADDLPFIKRKGYAAEREFRILHTGKGYSCGYPRFDFDLDAITRITVSPWLHEDYFSEVKKMLKDTKLPSSIPIYRSTLIGNRTWQAFAKGAHT